MANLYERVEELHRRATELQGQPERLGSSEKHIDRRVEDCEDRLCAIEKAPYIDDRIVEHQKLIEALEHTAGLHAMCLRGERASSLLARIEALEARLRAPIPVVTPLAGAQIGPGAGAPQNVALPDYLLAPTPDYRSDPPPEVDACGCEESEALRSELGAASIELRQLAAECDRLRAVVPFPDDPDRVATLAVKLASETAKREAVESELSAALQTIDLLRSLDNVQRAVAYLDRAEKAEQRVAEQRERIKQDCIAAEERAAEVDRLREALAAAEREMRSSHRVCENLLRARDAAEARARELDVECERLRGVDAKWLIARADLAAANALLRDLPEPGSYISSTLRDRVEAHLSSQPAAPTTPSLPTRSGEYEQGYAAGWLQGQRDAVARHAAPTGHERAALLEAMGRDMDRCRAGLKPEHAIDPRLDRYAERLADRVVGVISGKPEST